MYGYQLPAGRYCLFSSLLILEAIFQMHPKIRLGEIDPAKNLGVLLVEFFELYGLYFNYNTVGISINQGGSYFSKMQKGWQDTTKPWLLSIADPTDESASYLVLILMEAKSCEGSKRCLPWFIPDAEIA
jgi:DNA polymerase sigma